jgi:ankyrin repeat protein
LGIPAEETDNPENGSDQITILPSCHPLCPCHKCLTRSSGLGLDLDIKNVEGLSPLHLAVQFHVLVLVKILIRYGADINCQSKSKKTPLDYSIERGFHDIENVLLASGAMASTSFCQESPDECEKFLQL